MFMNASNASVVPRFSCSVGISVLVLYRKPAHSVHTCRCTIMGNTAVMEALSPDEVAVLCCVSFKRLHYGIDHALVRLNAEYGVSSEKRLAINALYMCMEYSGLVFVYVGVCGLRHCFILKCLFGHRVLSA